jgi:hypothetical protein
VKKSSLKENLTEASFQLFWKLQSFEENELVTLSGKSIQIISCGKLNYGPGPDFLEAWIRIDSVIHSGSIELHLRHKDWYNHNHHTDNLYNSVILHVFPSQPVDSNFTTLNCSENEVEMMMIKFTEQSSILAQPSISKPCSTTTLNREILLIQAKAASNFYLSESAQHLLKLGETSLGLEKSFKQSIILRLFELLGSPYQKEAGLRTGKILFQTLLSQNNITSDALIDAAYIRNWGQGKSIEKKISEAIELSEFIYSRSLPISLNDFYDYFSSLQDQINKSVTGLFWQQTLLRNIACLSTYTWASLIYQVNAMNYFCKIWETIHTTIPNSVKNQVPDSLRKQFNSFELSALYPNFLLDQHKTFCSKGNCLTCNFF